MIEQLKMISNCSGLICDLKIRIRLYFSLTIPILETNKNGFFQTYRLKAYITYRFNLLAPRVDYIIHLTKKLILKCEGIIEMISESQ